MLFAAARQLSGDGDALEHASASLNESVAMHLVALSLVLEVGWV